jgi:hypothetical protein
MRALLRSILAGNQFTLLWRGSRDGYRARDFHNRCDGHANTLTLIEDTGCNIFGGYTSVSWGSSRPRGVKGPDPTESFLFTLKNPHGRPARQFPLKPDRKDSAITSSSKQGPTFGLGDIAVSDDCDTRASSARKFGTTYENDTKIDGAIFLTFCERFLVKDIEVFERKM